MSKPRCWNCRKRLQEYGTHCAGCGAVKMKESGDWKEMRSAVRVWLKMHYRNNPAAFCRPTIYLAQDEALRVLRGELVLH